MDFYPAEQSSEGGKVWYKIYANTVEQDVHLTDPYDTPEEKLKLKQEGQKKNLEH